MHLRPTDFRGSARFTVLKELGSGATGIVYAAEDRASGARVALKVLRSMAPEAVAEFKREFRTIADLEHPNLVRLGELIAEGDHWLFTMELVEGVDFFEYVRPEGVLDSERLREALAQLVSGLAALHAHGQVHRDVKPSNVLVRENGTVKLLDFGLATAVDADGANRSDAPAVGTTAYVAPEQAAGRAVGPAADYYAVGVMLYEALTGKLPFDGPPLKILMDKQTQPAEAPSQLVSGVDMDLERLCLELLAPEPTHRPGPARILGKLGARHRRTTRSQPTRSQMFFGRAEELDTLLRPLAGRMRSYVRFVHGESGVGKTALLLRLSRRMAATGGLALVNRCREQESVPYRGLDGVFEDLAHHLSRAPADVVARALPAHAGLLGRTFPALSRVEAIARAPLDIASIANPMEQRRRAFAALRELLHALTKVQPVALLLDDLHFADDDSLELLKHLLYATDAPPLSLIATVNPAHSRSAEGRGFSLAELEANLPSSEPPLRLAELDRPSAVTLAAHLIELDPPPNAPAPERIAEAALGHPRLMEELVQHLKEHAYQGGELSLEHMIKMRTEALDPFSRRLLGLLAVAGTPVPPEVLRQASGLEPQELTRELTNLKLVRLVRTVGVRGKERLELYHDRIRDALLRELSEADVTAHHRALARAYEMLRSDEYESLSRHFRGAGVLDRAAEYATRAADEAREALAFARAARLYKEAIELRGQNVPPELFAHYGDALVSAGRGSEGARAYLKAAGDANTASAIDLRRRAAEQLLVSGHVQEGRAAARRVIADLGLPLSENPSWGRLRALFRGLATELRGLSFHPRDTSEIAALDLVRIDACWSLFVGFAAIDPLRAADPLTLHMVLALKAGEPARIGRALSAASSMASMLRGRAQRAQELAERAERIAERLAQPHLTGLCQLNQGLRAYHAGDLDVAKAAFVQAEHTLQTGVRSALWELGGAQFFLLLCHLLAGDVATLTRLTAKFHDEAETRGDLWTLGNLRARILPALSLIQGDPDQAQRHAESGKSNDSASRTLSLQAYWREFSMAERELYVGRPTDALRRVRALFPAMERGRLFDIRGVYVEAHWLRARASLAAMAARESGVKKRDILRDAEIIETADMGGTTGLSLSLRAALVELSGDRTTAIAAWRGAEAQLRADGRALLAQLARLRRGMLSSDPECERARREAQVWLQGAGVARTALLLRLYMPGSRTPSGG